MHHLGDNAKHVLDGVSLFTVLATLSAWLPPLAALLSVIWGCIRIFETETVQDWMKRRKGRG